MSETKSTLSFIDLTPEAREAAQRAARAAGMPVEDWLAQLIKHTSAMELRDTARRRILDIAAPGGAKPAPQAAPAAPTPPAAATPAAPLPRFSKTFSPPALPRRAIEPAAAPVPPTAPAPAAPASAPPAAPVAMPPRQAPAPGPAVRAPALAAALPEPSPPAPPAEPPPVADPLLKGDVPSVSAERDSGEEETVPPLPARPLMVSPDQIVPNRSPVLSAPGEDDIQSALDRWRASGMLEPLLCRTRPNQRGQFEIVTGAERWHAARRAYVRQIPIVVRDLSDREALELALIDQLRRGTASPIAEANVYLRLLNDVGLPPDRIARLAGRPASHVGTMIRILSLPRPVRDMLERGELTVMHGRALLDAPNPEAIARDVVERRLDIYQTEQLVRIASRSAETIDMRVVEAEPATPEMPPEAPPAAPHSAEPPEAAAPEAEAEEAPTLLTATPLPIGGHRVAPPPSPPEPEAPAEPPRAEPAPPRRVADVVSTELLERQIANALGLKVAISERAGVGLVCVHYTNREELVRVLNRLNGQGSAG